MLILDKINFKTKNAIIDKRGHFIMIKGLIQQEAIIITYIQLKTEPQEL